MSVIDVGFDFQGEAGLDRAGVQRDSDKYSPTLQEYHRILWSKPLPNGKMFDLTKISSNRLFHKSELGKFYLSSDRAIATFSSWVKMKHIIDQIPARGFNRQIVDRLDLTIECIRRFYLGETSPLYETFLRYNDFFQLFDDFRSTPIPKTVDEYLSYMNMTSELIKLRNQRTDNYVTARKI